MNNTNGVNSFTMYFDYYNLIDTLTIKDKAILLIAITDYMFKDIEPKLSGHNQAIFNTLRNQLNLSKCNSKRKSKKEPKENQKETEQQPKENKTSILSFKFYISNFKFYISNFKFINDNELLESKLIEWLNYKQQRKDKPYTEIGLNTLLKKVDKSVELYKTEKVVNLIDDCIANNYQGIIFEKLKNTQTYSNNSFSNQKWEETKREFMNND